MEKKVSTNKDNIRKKSSKKGSNKKIVVKDMYKFITFVSVTLIFVIGLIVIIAVNAKVKIDSDTNLSKLNASKYKNEIKEEYEKDGKDAEFVQDWGKVQDSVGRYFIENYPSEKEQASELIQTLSDILSSDDWSKIEATKPTMWNGSWNVDENGNVKFKFASKDIEPEWASSLSDSNYIELN